MSTVKKAGKINFYFLIFFNFHVSIGHLEEQIIVKFEHSMETSFRYIEPQIFIIY
jgi:hypothetical protein